MFEQEMKRRKLRHSSSYIFLKVDECYKHVAPINGHYILVVWIISGGDDDDSGGDDDSGDDDKHAIPIVL